MDARQALPDGLTSLAASWEEALARPDYERASPEFEAKLVGICDGSRVSGSLESSTHFAFKSALIAALAGDFAQARRLWTALADNGASLRERAFAIDPRYGASYLAPPGSVLHHALAVGALADAAPSRAPLRALVEHVLGRLPKSKRSNLHQSVLLQIRTVAHAAVLAQDLELLRSVVDRRATIASFPRQWQVFVDIARKGRMETRDGVDYLRVDDAPLRDEFMAIFQANRMPWFDQAEAQVGERPYDGSLLGGFVHAWTWLQTFAPEPSSRCGWPRMRALLVG
jgi:hypothetical protein